MGTEIERKFLVDVDKLKKYAYPKGDDGVLEIEQAYIVSRTDVSVRARITSNPNLKDAMWYEPTAELGVKLGDGPIRMEFEQEINLSEAEDLISQYPSLHKIRYIFKISGSDRYEIELGDIDEEIELPNWVDEEITYNPEYLNCNLVK
ncbi:hypothetical protein LCGC14_2925720 [marine sediment metagenome]|uniref:CYTH domain-containing protein n=1 Tax=marine sediment metagenome TaxID=412755 RepID=A0A0F8XMI8_9ZZZZ